MDYRLATLLAPTTYTADKTEIIDIDIQDPISQIIIDYRPYNGGYAASPAAHPVKCLSKIELIDGSEVLFSLTGEESHAVDWYHRQKASHVWLHYLDNNYAVVPVILNFGRYLWDRELAFDPKKYRNPQLKITIDIDRGGMNADAGALIVTARCFDEKVISPVGFLMHKEIKSYTLVNSAHEYTDLPTDYPYRKLFIRAQRYGTDPSIQLSNIKLTEDVDKKIPFDHNTMVLVNSIVTDTKRYREYILGPGTTTARYFYCTPAFYVGFAACAWRSASAVGNISLYEGDGGRFTEIQENAGPNWSAIIDGYLPHGVIEVPFGLQDEIADWYEVAKIGSLKLDLTAGSSVGTSQSCEIFLQQLKRY